MARMAVGPGGPLRSRDVGGRRMAARLRTLEGLATEILGHLDLEATLLSLINAAVDLLGADIAGIMLVEEDDVLRMRACRGHRTVHSARLVARRGQGVAGKVFESGKACLVDDYLADPSISGHFREIVEREGTRSALGGPMTVRGRVIGTVMAWSRRPGAFTVAEEDVIVGLANLAAIAIENARLYETERRAVQTLEGANRRLEEQYALLQRATTVHERLTGLVLSGAGLSDLVSTVATQVGGEAVILDPDLAVLAMTADGEDVAVRARNHLERERRLADSAARDSALVEPAGKWKDWLLVRPVVAGGDRLGHLCVSLDHAPENLDPIIVEQAAIVCALELTKQRAVLEAHTRVRSDFIWDLLDGNVSDDAEAMVRARYLGFAFPLRLRVALISVDGFTAWVRQSGADADSVHRRWDAIVRAVERVAGGHCPARPLAARRGSVVALVVPCATPREADQGSAAGEVVAARTLAEAVIGGLRDAHPDLRFAVGVSACCALAGDLRQAGSQAASALASVSMMAAGQPVALFDDLGVVRFLLAPGDRNELSAFAYAVLGSVVDYDARHSSELVDTVDAYLTADCSLVRAAERLGIHPKTVRYRLDRAEELAGRDFSRQQDRFDAQLAVTIIRALSLGTPPGD